jgi:cytoskeletal protein CcmA (bactofilin family)
VAIFSNQPREATPAEPAHPMRRRSDQIPLSIIARDLAVLGDLETEGTIKIEGRIRGVVRAAGQVLISAGAVIEGDIHTKEAVVAGEVRGAIHAADRVELQASAVIVGDIHTRRIAILEGAKVTGEVKMDTAEGVEGDSHKSG